MRHVRGGLAAAALTAVILAWPAGAALANGTAGFGHDPNVRVFVPTPLVHAAVQPAPAEARPVKVVVHVLLDALALDRDYRRALAWEYRKDLIHRALGHRYTGFHKMYRGPRYPF